MAERGWVRPELVLIQAGVGGLLCAAVRHFRAYGDGTRVISVEPEDADCLLESITSPGGAPRTARGSQNSIMSGLNCGEVSLSAWPEIRATVNPEANGFGWHNSYRSGKGGDTLTSGLEGAWTSHPTRWDAGYFEMLFGHEWQLAKSPAGAWQWQPVAIAEADMPGFPGLRPGLAVLPHTGPHAVRVPEDAPAYLSNTRA